MAYDETTDYGLPGRKPDADPPEIQLPVGAAEGDAPKLIWGTTAPEGVVSGDPGDYYALFDTAASPSHAGQSASQGLQIWIKEYGTGNTGWVPIQASRMWLDGWYLDNVPANQTTATLLSKYAGGTVLHNFVVPQACYATGIVLLANAEPTAGSIVAGIGKADGVITGLSATLSNGATQKTGSDASTLYEARTVQRRDEAAATVTFAAGDLGCVKYTSTADLDPATIDIRVAIELSF